MLRTYSIPPAVRVEIATYPADLATTIDNLRQITDNLRALTEDPKRYPANVLYGEPPRSMEGRR